MSTKVTITLVLSDNTTDETMRDLLCDSLCASQREAYTRKEQAFSKQVQSAMKIATITVEPCRDEEEDE